MNEVNEEIRNIMLGYARENFFQGIRHSFKIYLGKPYEIYKEEYERLERLSTPDAHKHFDLGQAHGEVGRDPVEVDGDPDDINVIAYDAGYRIGQRWHSITRKTKRGTVLRLVQGGKA